MTIAHHYYKTETKRKGRERDRESESEQRRKRVSVEARKDERDNEVAGIDKREKEKREG